MQYSTRCCPGFWWPSWHLGSAFSSWQLVASWPALHSWHWPKINSELQTKCICFILYGITGLHCLHGLHSLHGWHCLHFLHGWGGLHGIGLGHLQKAMQDTTKLLGNHTGGLAGFALGHLQVHARTGEDKHMGWKTHLLINMHGLVKPKWNANIPCVYIPVVPHKAVAEVSKIGNL